MYEAEYGLEPSFADSVATQLAELRRGGFPGAREGLWLAKAGDEVVGTITLIEESRRLAAWRTSSLRAGGARHRRRAPASSRRCSPPPATAGYERLASLHVQRTSTAAGQPLPAARRSS